MRVCASWTCRNAVSLAHAATSQAWLQRPACLRVFLLSTCLQLCLTESTQASVKTFKINFKTVFTNAAASQGMARVDRSPQQPERGTKWVLPLSLWKEPALLTPGLQAVRGYLPTLSPQLPYCVRAAPGHQLGVPWLPGTSCPVAPHCLNHPLRGVKEGIILTLVKMVKNKQTKII